jgi:DNA invertase Pin-like site-specific DNA recombinase
MDEYVRSDEEASGQLLADRHGLEDLMKLAQQKPRPFDGIIFDDTSRFGRGLSNALRLSEELEYAKVFLYFVNRQLDSRNPSFRTLFIQYGQQDEQSSFGTAEKVHRGQMGRVLKGYISSCSPYAYKHVPIESSTRKGLYNRMAIEAVELEVIPEEAEVVVRIFELYANGLGHRAVAAKLSQEEIPSPLSARSEKKRSWNADTIKGILNNEKYRGVNVWNRTKTVRNPIKQRKEQHARPENEWVRVEVPSWRIVTDEQWNAAKAANAARQGPTWWKDGTLNRYEASRRYIFSGLLVCGDCGGRINIVGGENKNMRYGCVGHRSRGTCTNKLTILRSSLEQQMLEMISQKLIDPEIRKQLYEEYFHRRSEIEREMAANVMQVASNIEEVTGRRLELERMIENLLDTIQEAGRSSQLSKRLGSLETELSSINAQLLTQTEKQPDPISEEGVRLLIDRKLSELQAILTGDPILAKQQLRKYVDVLTMKATDSPECATYEVKGDICVFAPGDPDDVLLAGSLQRTCKQYTSISIPFEATLNARSAKGRNRSSVVAVM